MDQSLVLVSHDQLTSESHCCHKYLKSNPVDIATVLTAAASQFESVQVFLMWRSRKCSVSISSELIQLCYKQETAPSAVFPPIRINHRILMNFIEKRDRWSQNQLKIRTEPGLTPGPEPGLTPWPEPGPGPGLRPRVKAEQGQRPEPGLRPGLGPGPGLTRGRHVRGQSSRG